MVVKKKTKKILKIALVISLVLVLLSGIGLGVYFIVANKNPNEILSKTEREFGDAVKNYSVLPQESTFDKALLPQNIDIDNVVFFSDSIVVASDADDYSIFNLTLNSFIDLGVDYVTIDGVLGNFIFYTDTSLIYDKQLIL